MKVFSLLAGCNGKTDRRWELISATDGEITIKYLLRTREIKINKQIEPQPPATSICVHNNYSLDTTLYFIKDLFSFIHS